MSRAALAGPVPVWPQRCLRGIVAIALSALLAAVAVLTNGSVVATAAVPIALAAMLAMATDPRRTFTLLLFGALLFEQYQIFGLAPPVTLQVPFFENFNNSIGVPLPTNPVECLLGLMGGTYLFSRIVTRRRDFQSHPFQLPMIALAAMLAFFMAWGIARGGQVNIALWEVRALFYLVLTYLVGSQLVRDRTDVVRNTWAILIALAIKGFQGVWRWAVDLKFDIGEIPAITGHECAVFIMTGFVLATGLALFRGPRAMLAFCLVTAPTSLITFVYAQRRVAYGALVFGWVILFCYLPRETKRKFARAVLPLVPLVAIYFAAFWNSTSGIAMPVQQVRSIFGEDASGQEDSSNTYRDVEKINLVHTIRTYPLGRGFGQKYLVIMPLDEVDFPLWDYIPHNCVLWLWVKTGFVGMVTFLTVVALIIIQTTIDFRTTRCGLYRALQVVLIVFWVNQIVVSYYDLQLTFYRNMVYLGAFMALMVPIHREARAEAERLAATEAASCP